MITDEKTEKKFRFAGEGARRSEQAFKGKSAGYFKDAFKRFGKNKGALVALVVIGIQLLFALFAPLFSSYTVDFRDPYYLKITPSLSFNREHGIPFWNGEITTEGGRAKFDLYDGIAREQALAGGKTKPRAPLKSYSASKDGKSYSMKLDGYYEVGYIYKDLTQEEYDALKAYQNKTGIQIVYPLQNNYQAVNANQWYVLSGEHQEIAEKLHKDKARYAGANKAEAVRDGEGNIRPDYKLHFSQNAFGYDSLKLDFSSTPFPEGQPMYAAPVKTAESSEKSYKLQKDGEGRLYYWYNDETGYAYRDEEYNWQKAEEGVSFSDVPGYYVYAFENQSGYRVRVCYYEYFKFLHGEYPSFLFGTNQYGQDIFTCLAVGARLSFLLAIGVSFVNLLIGAAYGAVAGYYGGKTDIVLQRIAEIISAVPFIVVATLFQLHIGNSAGPVVTLLFAFVLTGWIPTATRVRMQFYRYKNREYVLAARSLGARDKRIIVKHIFPSAIGGIITGAALSVPSVIFSESMLSYLGIVNFETSRFTSIGGMLAQGQSLIASSPHVIFFPALFIALLLIGFNLIGNGLRDAFNPALRGVEE